MNATAIFYLASAGALGLVFWLLERHVRMKIFTWLPAIVMVYLLALALSQYGFFAHTPVQNEAYKTAKSWLLPMMIFLMMLRLDLRAFARLGRSLIVAYVGAVLSLAVAFVLVFVLFGFGPVDAGVFGALAGSWTGGTANMLAVASALDIPESRLGPALVVDSLLYTLWVASLLATVPLAAGFNRWSKARHATLQSEDADKTSPAGIFNVVLLIALALAAAFASQIVSQLLPLLPQTTWLVLIATAFGLAASSSRLSRIAGSEVLASCLLFLLIALIGSHASLSGFAEVPRYLAAGAVILAVHALFMAVLARHFRLGLFALGIASLANIGGVASAPVLAAAYDRNLVGAAVVMALTGYLVGTLAGLGIAAALQAVAA